jgi:hypothetical protein
MGDSFYNQICLLQQYQKQIFLQIFCLVEISMWNVFLAWQQVRCIRMERWRLDVMQIALVNWCTDCIAGSGWYKAALLSRM